MMVDREASPNNPDVIRIDGRNMPVLDRWSVGGRQYLILKRLSRCRLLAFAPQAAMNGALRLLHVLPKNRRTRQQVHVLARLNQIHGSLPALLEHHVRQDEIILITKWVRGIDLKEYLQVCRSGQRPWPSAVVAFSLIRKLAHGISQLHDRLNIVHGDLHPGNILFGYAPRQLVVIDFGSAWFESRAQGREEGDGIQEFYAAPELRIPGAAASERSDQFSLLVMLYEMLTGELPFEGLGGKAGWPEFREHFSSPAAFSEIALKQAGALPTSVREKFRALFRRGLAFDPAARFSSSREFRNSVDEIEHEIRAPAGQRGINRLISEGISWIVDRISG